MAVLYVALGGPNVTSDLYIADPATGVLTSVGPIGFALTALMVDPAGRLYGATSNNSAANPGSLVSIDRATGAGTLIGSFFSSSRSLADAAFDASGNLWGWDSFGGGLVSVDIATGVGTHVGSISGDFAGAFDFDSGGVLWHVGGADRFSETVDTTTGAVTHVASMSTPDLMQAGKFDSGGVLWAARQVSTSVSRLVTIDETTGVVTDVATFSLARVDALAWVAGTPPPRPATALFDGGPAFKRAA